MTAAASKLIGEIRCLVCGETVELREMKTKLACYGCPECGVQVMTRGRRADRELRAKVAASPEAPPKPAPAPAPKPAPAVKPAPTTKKETPRVERPAAAQPVNDGKRSWDPLA